MRITGAAIVLAIASPAIGQSKNPAASLCQPDEQVIYTCPTGDKIVSICAAPGKAGILRYRFGRPGVVELTYPANGQAGSGVFLLGSLLFSGGGGAWLRFENKGYVYTVFTATGKWGPGGAIAGASGVAVTHAGKPVTNLVCRAPAVGALGPPLISHTGVRKASPDDDFEIPERFLPRPAR